MRARTVRTASWASVVSSRVSNAPELAPQRVSQLDGIQNMQGTRWTRRTKTGQPLAIYHIRWLSISSRSQIRQRAARLSVSLGRQACRWPAEGGLYPRLCASCHTSSTGEVSGSTETAAQTYPRQHRLTVVYKSTLSNSMRPIRSNIYEQVTSKSVVTQPRVRRVVCEPRV